MGKTNIIGGRVDIEGETEKGKMASQLIHYCFLYLSI
jgi:hypothetical protein